MKRWRNILSAIFLEIRTHRYKKVLHQLIRKLKSKMFGYPYTVIIEPINVCNLNCEVCSIPQKYITKDRKTLEFNDFGRLIDGLKNYTHNVLLFFGGEPLLNNKIYQMISYAEENNMDTEISTNAMLLKKDVSKKLIESGLSYLIISFDGASKESYEAFRRGADFETVKENVKYFCLKKKDMGRNKPIVELQCVVTRFNEHELKEVESLGKWLGVDRLRFKSLSLGEFIYSKSEVSEFAKKWLPIYGKKRYTLNGVKTTRYNKCPQREILVILVDGTVTPCCFDINGTYSPGNLLKTDFKTLWNSKEFKEMQKNKINMKFLLCEKCGA